MFELKFRGQRGFRSLGFDRALLVTDPAHRPTAMAHRGLQLAKAQNLLWRLPFPAVSHSPPGPSMAAIRFHTWQRSCAAVAQRTAAAGELGHSAHQRAFCGTVVRHAAVGTRFRMLRWFATGARKDIYYHGSLAEGLKRGAQALTLAVGGALLLTSVARPFSDPHRAAPCASPCHASAQLTEAPWRGAGMGRYKCRDTAPRQRAAAGGMGAREGGDGAQGRG